MSPDQPATPAPRHEDAFFGVEAPRTPSFNEQDVSDKPMWVRNTPLRTPAQIAQLDALYRNRLQSMLAVEDLVQRLIETLRAVSQLGNTYIVFTSDNGFHLGQHWSVRESPPRIWPKPNKPVTRGNKALMVSKS